MTAKKAPARKATKSAPAARKAAPRVEQAAPRAKKAAPGAKKAAPRVAKAPSPPSTSKHPPKQRSAATLALIDRLRAICMSLPGAVEKEAWAEPTWRAGGKIFAQCDTYHHGSPHLSVWVPAPPGAQEALIDSDPTRYFRPAYVGHRGWVAMVLDTGPDWGAVASLLEIAHGMVTNRRRRGSRPRA